MYRIAIIGRPNVGKSTLFNKLVGRRKSIVEPTPGVTRDVNQEVFTIKKQAVMIFDTGGLVDRSNDVLNKKVQERAVAKAESADLIIFMVDVNDFHPDDGF
ncbi:MAG: GTPase, partial [Spirochaetota bacterium]